MKGYVLDQGSLPTHRGIISVFTHKELKTSHSQEAVDRYIKQYDQIRKLIRKDMDETGIKEITGKSIKFVKNILNYIRI